MLQFQTEVINQWRWSNKFWHNPRHCWPIHLLLSRLFTQPLNFCDGLCAKSSILVLMICCKNTRCAFWMSAVMTKTRSQGRQVIRETLSSLFSHIHVSVKYSAFKSFIFTSLVVCRPCECDPSGSVGDCASLDGRCHCKPNVEGHSCDRCVISVHICAHITSTVVTEATVEVLHNRTTCGKY